MMQRLVGVLAIALLGIPVQAQGSQRMQEVIDQSTRLLVENWLSDQVVEQFKPPQVLPLAAGSKVYGACEELITGHEVGGSGYCSNTHTIYLVPEELREFEEAFGASSVAYVVAHEFGHAFQAALEVPLEGAARELQADCFAGMLINNGNEQLGITREDVLAMATAAYNIGSDTHGTGPQRTFALLVGMGVFDSNCEADTMQSLANGAFDNDSRIKELSQERSAGYRLDTSTSPYRKDARLLFGL